MVFSGTGRSRRRRSGVLRRVRSSNSPRASRRRGRVPSHRAPARNDTSWRRRTVSTSSGSTTSSGCSRSTVPPSRNPCTVHLDDDEEKREQFSMARESQKRLCIDMPTMCGRTRQDGCQSFGDGDLFGDGFDGQQVHSGQSVAAKGAGIGRAHFLCSKSGETTNDVNGQPSHRFTIDLPWFD